MSVSFYSLLLRTICKLTLTPTKQNKTKATRNSAKKWQKKKSTLGWKNSCIYMLAVETFTYSSGNIWVIPLKYLLESLVMKSDEPIIGPESTSFINPRIEAKGRIEFLSHHKGQFFFFLQNLKLFIFFVLIFSSNFFSFLPIWTY